MVVGGAGYIGSMVAANLLDAGYDVIVFDALLYGDSAIRTLIDRPGFDLVVGDTRDVPLVQRELSKVGAVIHLGEIVGDPACDLDPVVTRSVNLLATARLATLAAAAGVQRFLYASSCSVYGATEEVAHENARLRPVSLYGNLKRDSEQAVLSLASSEFLPTVFRLATAYGLSPRLRFDLVVNILAGRAAEDGAIVVQGGGQWRPFVHVADVASLLVRALELPGATVGGEVFNIGSNSQNYTIAQVAEIVQEQLPSVRVLVSDGIDPRNYRVAFDKAAERLGFQPKRTVADGVAEIVRAVGNGHVGSVRNPGYSNVRALIETPARLRLWRPDLGDGDPTRPFSPRDLDPVPLRAPAPLEVAEPTLS